MCSLLDDQGEPPFTPAIPPSGTQWRKSSSGLVPLPQGPRLRSLIETRTRDDVEVTDFVEDSEPSVSYLYPVTYYLFI